MEKIYTKLFFFLLIICCFLLQGCPHNIVSQINKQVKKIEEYKTKRPVYITQNKNLTNSSDLKTAYFNDSLQNYDSLIKTDKFPLRFELNKIETDSFPEKITLRALIYDTTGKYISGLAPPYYKGSGNYKEYWSFVNDSCKGSNRENQDFEVEEVRNNQNKPYSIAFVLDHSGSMGNTRIVKLQEAVKHVLYAVKKEDMIGAVKFAGKPFYEVPLTNSPSIYRNNFTIDSTNKGDYDYLSGSAMFTSLDFIISQFDTIDSKYKKVIILFSDGEDNKSKINQDSILKLVKLKNIEIYSIAYGYSDDNIEELAEKSGGKFYYLISTKEFPYVFKDIYSSLNNYYKITYKPDGYYDKHKVNVRLSLPFLKNVSLEAAGNYDKSIFTSADPVGTVYLMNVEFDFGKADIKKESLEKISEVAHAMKNNPKMKIKISGHTDDSGGDEFNRLLSLQRAGSVRNELIKFGINENRLFIEGYGESKPLVPNDSEENKKKNRRTEFEIIEK